MSFPWATAITAGSTLLAGWGGISLKDWHDARRARQDRRRAAYLELVFRLDHLARLLSAPQTLDAGGLAATLGAATGQAVGEIQRAYFSVFLIAPRDIQVLAGAAWDAAWRINDWFDSAGPGPADPGELRQRLDDLKRKSEAFATAVRAAEGGPLPAPAPAVSARDCHSDA